MFMSVGTSPSHHVEAQSFERVGHIVSLVIY